MASGGDLPHDLYTCVIEDALGIEYGFWGCVAVGATFKTLGRKRTPQGKASIARHLEDLDSAEARVNEIYFAWRSGGPTLFDDELDSMLARWRALTESEEHPPVGEPAFDQSPTARCFGLVHHRLAGHRMTNSGGSPP